MDSTDALNVAAQQSVSKQMYAQQTPLLQAVDWLLANPSIPLDFRKQFYVLWEIAVFGNFDEMDIKILRLKFKEWCILMKWHVPDHQWGNTISFENTDQKVSTINPDGTVSEQNNAGGSSNMVLDYNLLFNMLEQMYIVQLSRGKDGFTVKEMTSSRSIVRGEGSLEPQKKKGISLF